MIDIPPRLRDRPRDARGFVIPWTQFIRPDGMPDFRILDHERAREALRRRLCSMCGQPMGKFVCFIGGPKCVQFGVFYDPPMHRDCATFAIQICPHLARAKGRYSEPVARGDLGDDVKLVVGAMDDTKADWFGLMVSRDYTYGRGHDDMILIKAKLPWESVERWRDGKQQ